MREPPRPRTRSSTTSGRRRRAASRKRQELSKSRTWTTRPESMRVSKGAARPCRNHDISVLGVLPVHGLLPGHKAHSAPRERSLDSGNTDQARGHDPVGWQFDHNPRRLSAPSPSYRAQSVWEICQCGAREVVVSADVGCLVGDHGSQSRLRRNHERFLGQNAGAVWGRVGPAVEVW